MKAKETFEEQMRNMLQGTPGEVGEYARDLVYVMGIVGKTGWSYSEVEALKPEKLKDIYTYFKVIGEIENGQVNQHIS